MRDTVYPIERDALHEWFADTLQCRDRSGNTKYAQQMVAESAHSAGTKSNKPIGC